MRKSPCEACGACCAYFRVSFPTSETDEVACHPVPLDMTLFLNESQRYMKGTHGMSPRCIALEGNVGVDVKCTIYENRPSTCRKFNLSWKNDIGNMRCERARGSFGLQPFSRY